MKQKDISPHRFYFENTHYQWSGKFFSIAPIANLYDFETTRSGMKLNLI